MMDDQNRNIAFSDYTLESSGTQAVSKRFFANVFLWMFGALAVSTFFAYLFSTNLQLLSYLVAANGKGLNTLGWVVMFAPIGFVMLMSFGFQRLSAPLMAGLFLAYSAVNGISFAFILMAYTTGSIIGCFASAAAMFGVMAVMGYTTKKDLTGFGRILTMGLIGILVAFVVNFFLKSNTLDYIISLIGVAVFTGLTAYDVQKLKRISVGIEFEGTEAAGVRKLSIMGALTLYLDFINLFLMLLRLFGRRR
ncbi:MAG: Bax inhibitor-1/YccA family protein [Bacteroidetes bacterium]|nr:Bax inhibitor-1/YccA family protein [Bacteroidota bacterium]MBS1630887.1 Bax inhibitor-1/YccA family protein [Bacteroidota bacterium]